MANIKPERTARLFPGEKTRFSNVLVARTDTGLKIEDQEHETHIFFEVPSCMTGAKCLVILSADQVFIYVGTSFGASMLKKDLILAQHGLA